MAFIKSLVVLAVVAIAIGRQVDAEMRDLCSLMAEELEDFKDQGMDRMQAYEFAKKYIEENTPASSSDRRLIRSWEAVAKDEECSQSSWGYVRDMMDCMPEELQWLIDEPIVAYTRKCITPELASRHIKSLASNQNASHVDFVDAEFVKKFYQDNPNDPPLRLLAADYAGYDKASVKAYKSYGALEDAIWRHLEKAGKDPRKRPAHAFFNYLTQNLFEPCFKFVQHYRGLPKELSSVSWNREGGEQALIAELDQEARDFIFRFKYCRMIADVKLHMMDEMDLRIERIQ